MLETPRLRQEQPATDPDEAARLTDLAQLIDTTAPLPDLRDLAPAVREAFPAPAYSVGCGSSHIWILRTTDQTRLAIVINHQ